MKKSNSKKNNWVSASDVGRASYCPHYLELKRRGAQPSKEAVIARAKGEDRHEMLNRQAEDKRCYVATYLYGIDDARTNLLRHYRDQKLTTHRLGRLSINVYYALSPFLVTIARQIPVLDKLIRYLVNDIVRRIQKDQTYD